MQKLIILITIIALTSCSNKEDKNLKLLTEKRDAISKKIEEQNVELAKVNESIAKLQKVDSRESIIPHTIALQPFQHTIDIQSNVSTEQDVMIYPEFMGTLTWLVKEGQQVSKGQVIASVNDGGMSSQLQQVKIQADLAKTAYEKQSRLWNEKIGSEIQYLQAKTAYEAAQKSISAMQSQLGRTKIKAPFSGTIDNQMMQSGQAVAPGMPIAKIVNLGNMKITADISEQYITKVKVGTPANINLSTINQVMQGKIARVSNSINPSNRTFGIEIPIPNKGGMIKPNMSAKINLIDYQNANAIVVPNASIQTNAAGEKYVYTLTQINGKSATATKSKIVIGQSNTDFTEVLMGLKIGDVVIKEGSKSIVDKSQIVISN
jgi:membrane fusion protein, multidrug efflux system